MADDSKLREMCKDGCLAAFYTQNGYFVKIKPAYDIDRMKFCFVEKGKKGTGFDVYVDIQVFDLLCRDILSESLAKAIQAEKSDYPTAWKIVTGEKGNKSVAIGKSKNGGVVIHGTILGEKSKNAFVPTTYNDLRMMAIMYERMSQNYWDEIRDIFLAGYQNAQQFFKKEAVDEPVAEATEASVPEQTNEVQFAHFSALQALPFQKTAGFGVKVRNKEGNEFVMSIAAPQMNDRVKLLIDKIEQVHAKGGSVGFSCEYKIMKDGNLSFVKLAS